MEKISAEELVRIAQNLKYLLYGVGCAGSCALLLLGVSTRYVWKRLAKLDSLEAVVVSVQTRMDGIGSISRAVIELDGRMTACERFCSRQHDNGGDNETRNGDNI